MSKKSRFDLAEFRGIPLPSESEIMADWKGDAEHPVVSVLCNTYNQAMYIEDAIRGFLIQKTDFPFEVIINDDASTDENPTIIAYYEKNYPKIIKAVFQKENQYSQGKKPSAVSFPHATGTYVAFCEGDDFWITPTKLQVQRDAIEREEVGLVFSSAVVLKNNKIGGLTGQCDSRETFLSFSRIVSGGASYCPTASIFVKREALSTLFNESWFLQAPVGDLYIQAYTASSEGAYFLGYPTCVYRRFSKGSWSVTKGTIKEEEIFLDRQLLGIEGLFRSLTDYDHELYRKMRANAYYHSALRFLKSGENRVSKELLEKADSEGSEKSRGHHLFYFFRSVPLLSKLIASVLVFR